MGLHRDFLVRMIERFAAAFFRIMAGKKTEDPHQAQIDIEELLGEALQSSPEYVLGLGPAAIDPLEPQLAAQVARLLMLHASLSDEIGQPDRAARARRMGFRAIERSLGRPGTDFAQIAADTLRNELHELEELVPPATLAEACMEAHRHTSERKQWADTEDWLYFAMEIDDAYRPTARAFFEKLSALDDAAIESGGLTRDEVVGALDGLLD